MLTLMSREVKGDIIKLIVVMQLAVFVTLGLTIIGIELPIVRQILFLFYLMLIPGLSILNALNIKPLNLETILLSIGLSISATTFLFAFWSVVSSPFIERPLSEVPLTIFLGTFITVLILICHKRTNSYLICLRRIPPIYLALLFLPILMALGKILENDILIFGVLVIIAILPLLTLLRIKDEKIYPLVTWVMSLSIVFLRLISQSKFNMAYDDQYPNISEAVATAGKWEPTFPAVHNSLLFPSIFSPISSLLLEMDVVVGFRFVGCIVASMIPVVLYVVYTKFFNSTHSFLAATLYTFYPFFPFYTGNMKSTYAFFFVSLLLLTIFNKELSPIKKSLLFIIFGFSIISSHYGTGYVFALLLSFSLILQLFEKLRGIDEKFVSYNYVILFFAMAFSWYLYTSSEVNFNWGINFVSFVLRNIQEFFSPEESPTVNAFITRSSSPSLSLEVTKCFIFTLLVLVFIGAIKLTYLYLKKKIDKSYAILTFPFTVVLLGVTITAGWRNMGLSLILTAPLVIMGFSEILRPLKVKQTKRLLLFLVYLLILFAFTFGLVANILNTASGKIVDVPFLGYSEKGITMSELSPEFKRSAYARLYLERWPDSTFEAVNWFFAHQKPNETIFADILLYKSAALKIMMPEKYGGEVLHNLVQPQIGSLEKVLIDNRLYKGYIFLAYHNIHDDFLYFEDRSGNPIYLKTSNYHDTFEEANKIYDSGGAIIYHNEKE